MLKLAPVFCMGLPGFATDRTLRCVPLAQGKTRHCFLYSVPACAVGVAENRELRALPLVPTATPPALPAALRVTSGWWGSTSVQSLGLHNGQGNNLHVSSDLGFASRVLLRFAASSQSPLHLGWGLLFGHSIKTNIDSRTVDIDTSEKASSKLWWFSSLF